MNRLNPAHYDYEEMKQKEYQQLTVARLKEILREMGLKTSGRKKELVDRLLLQSYDEAPRLNVRISEGRINRLRSGAAVYNDYEEMKQKRCQQLTVARLKEILREMGLKTSGRKKELVDRLVQSYDEAPRSLRVNQFLRFSGGQATRNNDDFVQTDKKFTKELINHFKKRIQEYVESVERGEYLEISFYEDNPAGVEYRNWRSNVLKDIANGKRYEESDSSLHKTVNDILMGKSFLWRQSPTTWMLKHFIIASKEGRIVISPTGARHILAQQDEK